MESKNLKIGRPPVGERHAVQVRMSGHDVRTLDELRARGVGETRAAVLRQGLAVLAESEGLQLRGDVAPYRRRMSAEEFEQAKQAYDCARLEQLAKKN